MSDCRVGEAGKAGVLTRMFVPDVRLTVGTRPAAA
jgi:hypothetical protein